MRGGRTVQEKREKKWKNDAYDRRHVSTFLALFLQKVATVLFSRTVSYSRTTGSCR